MKIKMMTIVAAAAAMLASCGGGQSGKPNFGDNEYAVRTAAATSVELESSYAATMLGLQSVEVRPKVSGFITKTNIREGQAVHAGQVLFTIDNVTYAAAARQAKAAVATAKAALGTATLTYNNNVELHKNHVIGDYELQTAENQLAQAKAQLAQAEASYTSAKQNLDFCFVTSPVNGVAGTLPYSTGALVSGQSAQPLTTVSDNKTVRVYFSMTEKDMLEMQKGAANVADVVKAFPPVRLKTADGQMFAHEGKVVSISQVIDQQTGTVSVRADFTNPENLLKSGGTATVYIPHQNNNALVVSQEAVIEIQDKMFMYLVTKDNKAKYTEVTVEKINDGKQYIVTSGLAAGDRYVSKGVTALADGADIVPITEQRYQQKIDEAKELGKSQGDAKKLKAALGK